MEGAKPADEVEHRNAVGHRHVERLLGAVLRDFEGEVGVEELEVAAPARLTGLEMRDARNDVAIGADLGEIRTMLAGVEYAECWALAVHVLGVLVVPEEVDPDNGRPGMALWKILVLGTLRLSLNWDYDRLLEMVNQHRTIRQMLGHGWRDEETTYALQTLKDNVSLLTPEVVDRLHGGTELVMTWPVDTPEALADARRLGVDAVISKDLGLLRGVLDGQRDLP